MDDILDGRIYYSPDLEANWNDIISNEAEYLSHLEEDAQEEYGSFFEHKELKGLLVIYINVDNMSSSKAKQHIDDMRNSCERLKYIPLDYAVIWLGVKSPLQNKIELIKF